MSQLWSTSAIIAEFLPGDARPWAQEIRHLWDVHPHELSALLHDIRRRGIVYPIQVNDEGAGVFRVIDGHHRVAVAVALLLPVPVEFVKLKDGLR